MRVRIHRSARLGGVCALILALAGLAAPQAQPLPDFRLGDSFEGSIDSADDADVVLIPALLGSQVRLSVKGAKGFLPTLTVSDPLNGTRSCGGGLSCKGTGKSKLKTDLAFTHTGASVLEIGGLGAATGEYKVQTKLRPPKNQKHVLLVDGDTLRFGALAGSELSFSLKPDKTFGNPGAPVIDGVIDPDGIPLDLAGFVKATSKKASLKKLVLPTSGDYTVLIGTASGGQVQAALTVKPPKIKGVTHAVGDVLTESGTLLGTAVTASSERMFSEIEPNDLQAEANPVGVLTLEEVLHVVGRLETEGDQDAYRVTFDGQAPAMLLVHFDQDVDFDVTIVSLQGDVLASYETDAAPEQGLLSVSQGETVDVIVHAASGSGPYRMQMIDGTKVPDELIPDLVAQLADPVTTPARFDVDHYRELDAEFVPDELIVKLRDDARDPGAWAAQQGLTLRAGRAGLSVLVGFPELTGQQDLQATREYTLRRRLELQEHPDVLYAEPNYIVHAHIEPNDPQYGSQWHYPLIGLEQAWEQFSGSDDVVVAVLDTGITPHPDLVDRDSHTGYDMVNSNMSLDGDGPDPDPNDPGDKTLPGGWSSFHGTHVSGTIGATSNNGVGVAGVTWATQLMHVRVLGWGGGTHYDVGQGIRYAAGLENFTGQLPAKRADVINMSLGGASSSADMSGAVFAARQAGVSIVASAGNSNSSQPNYPASLAGVISVASVKANKTKSEFSNWGSTIDVAAPGSNVLSTWIDETSGNAPIYATQNGTSMAAPHVAGVMALMLGLAPELSVEQAEVLLKATCEDLGSPGHDVYFGAGLIDAAQVLETIAGASSGPPVLWADVGESMQFHNNDIDEISISVLNTGGGFLFLSASSTEDDGGDWLHAGLDSATAPAQLTVSVDRFALTPGIHSGNVVIESDAGTIEFVVLVTQAYPETLAPWNYVTYDNVLAAAFPLEGGEPVATGNLGTVVDWKDSPITLLDLPPGDYVVVAGPDFDGDGAIGGLGEPIALPENGHVTVGSDEVVFLEQLTIINWFDHEEVPPLGGLFVGDGDG